MHWYRTEETIIEQWQTDSAYSLEAGEQPLFNLGSINTTVDGLLEFTSLQKMIEKHENIIQPVIAMGGHCPLWLFALLQTTRIQSHSHQDEKQPYAKRMHRSASEANIVFTAIDTATHIAALTSQTAASRTDSINTLSPKVRWTGLDAGMYELFAPGSEPSANSPIESLPFTTEPIRNQHNLGNYTQTGAVTRHSDSSISADEQTTWTRRAMIGVAILMIITALFV